MTARRRLISAQRDTFGRYLYDNILFLTRRLPQETFTYDFEDNGSKGSGLKYTVTTEMLARPRFLP